MTGSADRSPIRQASVCLLVLALVFVGVNVAPAPLPPAHAQALNVVGTILGLVVIAGVVYLLTRDRNGVYYRYPYGHYRSTVARYDYDGPYHPRYRTYEGRFYNGPMPRAWVRDRGCVASGNVPPRCR